MMWLLLACSFAVTVITLVVVAKKWGESAGEAQANEDVARRMKAYEDIDQEPDVSNPYDASKWMQ